MMDSWIYAIWNSQGKKLSSVNNREIGARCLTAEVTCKRIPHERSQTERQGCPAGSTYILDVPQKAQITRLQAFTRDLYMSLNKQNGQPNYLVSSHSEWPCIVHCMLRGRASGLGNDCYEVGRNQIQHGIYGIACSNFVCSLFTVKSVSPKSGCLGRGRVSVDPPPFL